MNGKKWIVVGLVFASSALLAATVAAGPGAGVGSTASTAGRTAIAASSPVSTTFTYQGRLDQDGEPVNGDCTMAFRLYDEPVGGGQVGDALTLTVPISDGLFTVGLDFGRVFTGTARWLGIGVQCPGDAGLTTLSPRHALTPAPYALALPGLWTEQNGTSPNLIGGYSGNYVAPGVVGASIGGGGASGSPNQVTNAYSVVGGGIANTASGEYATIEGGTDNTASGLAAAVGGGAGNTASGSWATIGGGSPNTASGSWATVGGGADNTASGLVTTVGGGGLNTAGGQYATVGGGNANTASGEYATIGGGESNTASGGHATVSGGDWNTASGFHATVGGGDRSTASGDYSFAAGRRAKANHQGAFVWADSTNLDVASTANDQFLVRASGGVTMYTGTHLDTGSYLSAGGSSWNTVSDRARKENFRPVDAQALLANLAEIPISTWNYKAQDPAIRHIGPMAQDFNGLLDDLGGEGERYINTLDADGVAMAAIQGLYAQNQALAAQNAALEARLSALEAGSHDDPATSPAPSARLLPWAAVVLAVIALVRASRRREDLIPFSGGGR